MCQREISALSRQPAHYSAYCHYWLLSSVPSDFTGNILGNRHYSTGAIEGPLLIPYANRPIRVPPSFAGNHLHAATTVTKRALCAKGKEKKNVTTTKDRTPSAKIQEKIISAEQLPAEKKIAADQETRKAPLVAGESEPRTIYPLQGGGELRTTETFASWQATNPPTDAENTTPRGSF